MDAKYEKYDIDENMITLHDMENVGVIMMTKGRRCVLTPSFMEFLLRQIDMATTFTIKSGKWDYVKFLEDSLFSWYRECGGDTDMPTVRRGAVMLNRVSRNSGYSMEHYANVHITLD
jgi:hypothetical protein